ncbi:hypothetical protein D1007_20141 [Hordeum vulgare]|nr:hypothetical protein D1007_20141 [Hordeum vulgare]
MAGGFSSKRSSAQQASLQGAWLGSDVDAGLIDVLRHHRLLPPVSQVSVRLPGSEASPAPVAGEVVVFAEHFYRGFGLPASSFFAEWLQFFGLQPHHLAPNAILQLAAFVVMCEGFVGIEPRVDLWCSLFFFKQKSIAMEKSEVKKLQGPCPMTPCGAALVHHRPKSVFPQMPLQVSIKHWQKGFFYVRSTDPAQDALNMPMFAIAPPTRQNRDAKTPKPHPEVVLIRAHLDILRESGLLGRDLLAAMVVRRILPLQRQPHLVCQMSGRLDPCRLSNKRLTSCAVARRVNLISTARMDEGGEWTWGMAPFNRSHTPPMMFQTLQGSLPQPAPDVEASDASEMEDEDAMEPRSDSSAGTGDPLESEGTEPSGEYPRHALADWTDDDEEASFCFDAALEGDFDKVGEVTGPLPLRGRRQGGRAPLLTRQPGGRARVPQHPDRPLSDRRRVLQPGSGQTAPKGVVAVTGRRSREAEDADEDTASAAERAGWAAVNAANKELEAESKCRWDTAVGKAAVDQPCPSRVERPVEKHAKARQDPSAHARVEEPASDAASRPVPRTEGAQPSEPAASEHVVLETIPVSPRAEAAPDAPALDLTAPDAAPDAPGATMDAPDAAHPPPAEEGSADWDGTRAVRRAGTRSRRHRRPPAGPCCAKGRGRPGSQPMKSWRAANAARLKMPAGTVLSGVPELVTLFDNGRTKVEQAARVALYDAQVHAYNELRDEHLRADSRITELEVRLGEADAECDALREAGGRLQERLNLLQAENKELEAVGRVELERLWATLQEKEASYSADMDRLAAHHLEEANLKDDALKAKDEALTQKQTQLVAADTAVEVCRKERRAAGQEVDTTSGWSGEEIGVGLRARLHVLSESVTQLQVAGSSMVAALWPEGVEPTTMSRLARWLVAGGERLDTWRASATRSGAYMALCLAKSWYRNLNLGKLAAQHDGSEAELHGMEEELRVRASAVAEYAA